MENAKKLVTEFEWRVKAEVRRQEKLIRWRRETIGGESCQEDIWQECCMDRMIENSKTNI